MKSIDDLICEFTAAHIAAEPNAGIMCNRPSRGAIDGCVERMRRVDAADEAVYAVAGQDGLPPLLKAFLDAESDRGCVHCWLSARAQKKHPECAKKIIRWFAARAALIEYGMTLCQQHAVYDLP